MLDSIPNKKQLIELLGEERYDNWVKASHLVEEQYEMEILWNKGYSDWVYEHKYRRGGKTLCTFYMKKDTLCILIIFGKNEREKFELQMAEFGDVIRDIYLNTETYHDGKWMLIPMDDMTISSDIMKLLLIKRRPNRKKA